MSEYEFPEDCRYGKTDEWVREEGGHVRLGVTDYAQCQLGDVVFVELPEVGAAITPGTGFGVIESVKAVSDLFSPIEGEVVEVNTALEDAPEKVNESCYGDGWILLIKPKDASSLEGLMDSSAYRTHVDDRAE